MIKVSIIMPSYYRPKLLNWGLYSLSQQKCKYSFEIIVLNDGIHDNTEEVCKKYSGKLNIKYVFTGQRNLKSPKWRIPGVVFNEGVRLAQGEIIILSSPEIFYLNENSLANLIEPIYRDPNLVTIPEGKDDTKKIFLNHLETCKNRINYLLYNELEGKLNSNLPFCMGMKKRNFYAIGGFDSAFFNGYCFDDTDFADRLIESGCKYYNADAKVIHLYNSRRDRIGLTNRNQLWTKNKQLYEERKRARKNKGTKLPQKQTAIKPIITHTETKPNFVTKPVPKCAVTEIISPDIKVSEIRLGDKIKWHLEKIPKIAHFYWGNKELPFLRYLTIQSFHKYNPDWEIRFYYPKYRSEAKTWKTHEHKYEVKLEKDYYSKLKRFPIIFIEMDFDILNVSNDLPEVHKSDYLRWHLLANVGGLWSDMDVIYYDSINKINVNQFHNKDINTVMCYHGNCFSIGFLLSAPNSGFYKLIWEKAMEDIYDPKEYQTIGVVLVNPLMKNFKDIQEKYPDLKTANLSMEATYNYDSHMLKTIYDTTNLEYITEKTIALHWYAGCLAARQVVNEMTDKNYNDFNNVVSKTVDICLNEKKEEVIANNRGMPLHFIKVKNRKPLTVHTVCRDEPFIYYAIKSVYDYAEKILLYDTGTTNEIALEGITRLLKEDNENKIIYKTFDIGDEETKVVATKEGTKPKKKFGIGQIRQIMIDDTDTEFFFTVDGDEVFYKGMMDEIVNEIIPNCAEGIYQVGLPLVWFYDINHTCDINGNVLSGRLYKTNKVFMTGSYPDEFHTIKETGEVLMIRSKNFWTYPKPLPPFGHFNLLIKPNKYQYIKRKDIKKLDRKLPEVMEEEPYFIESLLKEDKNERI